jgi:hypothetical protein
LVLTIHGEGLQLRLGTMPIGALANYGIAAAISTPNISPESIATAGIDAVGAGAR